MNKILFVSLCILLYTSCASSQNAAIQKEAEKKVKNLKPILGLTDLQAEKMTAIETAFLKESKKLPYSPSYQTQLKALQEKRENQLKDILSRDQFLKFDLLESGRLKKLPPVRAN